MQYPYLLVPDTNTHLETFLKHLSQVFIQAVHLTDNTSYDEQTIAFHGSSKHEIRIKLKIRRWFSSGYIVQ